MLVLRHSHNEKVFTDVQDTTGGEPPMFQSVSVASFLFLEYQLEKSSFVFFPPALHVFTDIGEIPSKPSLLQAKQYQLS